MKKRKRITDSQRIDYLEWMTLTKAKFFTDDPAVSLRQAIDAAIKREGKRV